MAYVIALSGRALKMQNDGELAMWKGYQIPNVAQLPPTKHSNEPLVTSIHEYSFKNGLCNQSKGCSTGSFSEKWF